MGEGRPGRCGTFGKLLTLDVTYEHLAAGALASYLVGKSALVIAPEGGRLVTIPEGDAAANLVTRAVTFELGADGTVAAGLRVRYCGQPGATVRGFISSSPKDHEQHLWTWCARPGSARSPAPMWSKRRTRKGA